MSRSSQAFPNFLSGLMLSFALLVGCRFLGNHTLFCSVAFRHANARSQAPALRNVFQCCSPHISALAISGPSLPAA